MSRKKPEKVAETVNLSQQQRDLADSLAAFRQLSRGEVLREAADRGMREMAAEDNKILTRQNLLAKRQPIEDIEEYDSDD